MAYIARKPINAAGVFIYAVDTKRYLFLLRNDLRYESTWALAGGSLEVDETLIQALNRECEEEIGVRPDWIRLVPVEQFTSTDKRFAYHSFFGSVAHEFIPILNDEHAGYAWVESGRWPKPLHPGLWSTVQFAEVQVKLHSLESQITE